VPVGFLGGGGRNHGRARSPDAAASRQPGLSSLNLP
jgi:hypothetical protein